MTVIALPRQEIAQMWLGSIHPVKLSITHNSHSQMRPELNVN